ncbi:MAG: hypothetical protein M3000_19415 [Bacillus wiedmannii]|uniref:Uncharacterized protein n=1 Tax=Bacillus thuringiensis TaxID=1428 RepID=A0A9X6V530_BACTU|nr:MULTISPECIES: hypothetical protein [Bacillus cereus group]MCT6917260.1 hypothetical protein [Bacillus wiedmannii]KIP29711.1 hypothetical protein BG10_7026 [Bacillus thuringiensis serovar morrisoni]MCT6948747.1 hypothetical protein [Bacillus thuringiensis]MCU5282030.1 hypothetical protein [Bacillus cereus]MEC3274680.1 hypothetical protein [Bacillus thuringiensis]
MKHHKNFDHIVWDFAEKWTEQKGVDLKRVSYVDPITGEDTLEFITKFNYVGKLEEKAYCPEVIETQSFSNSNCDVSREFLKKKVDRKECYLWDIDYGFIIPTSVLTNPLLPPTLNEKINPAMEVDLFKSANLFESKLNNYRMIEAGVYIEPNQAVTASIMVTPKQVQQDYCISLEISGSIIIELKDAYNACTDKETIETIFYTVPIADIYRSELAHNHSFHLDGETVIFTGKGTFKGLICSNIFVEGERFDSQTGECLGKYVIPLSIEKKNNVDCISIFLNSEKGGI